MPLEDSELLNEPDDDTVPDDDQLPEDMPVDEPKEVPEADEDVMVEGPGDSEPPEPQVDDHGSEEEI